MQEVGDEIWIYDFGAPNTFRHWPAQYTVDPTRRGSMFAPSYLGLATLPRDRFAYATGNGTLTTHPLEIGAGGLWLNADGDRLTIVALDSSGKASVSGWLSAERRQTVYRKVIWNGDPPRDSRVQIKLEPDERLYSILE